MTSVWTVELTEHLKRLYAAGLSSSQIANELCANVTRNAVIGRVHRLGLERRGKNGNYKGNGRIAGPKKPRTRSNPIVDRWGPKRAPLPFVANAADIVPRNLSIVDLEIGDCRYPYGETPFTVYCGHPKIPGSSYCSGHFVLARKDPKALDGQPAKMPVSMADGRHGRAVLA